MNKFEDFKLDKEVLEAIKRLGFKEPTQIQAQSIPLILEGKDIIGESATGSGKTLAFGAGIIHSCVPKQGIQGLILVPTRELAEQVKDEIVKFSYGKQLHILAVYGGVSMGNQIDKLPKTEIVIATPGRLLDHLDRRTINLSKVKFLVLDEADRMIEMGFIEDVEKIIKECPKQRQTLLFSATMYPEAKQIAKKYMNNPSQVQATKMVDPSKLKQMYYDVPSKLKKDLLVHLLQNEKSELVMVFCNTRRETDIVVDFLKFNHIKACAIHGGLTQSKRTKTMGLFGNEKFQVLVCTDVAARGLDIDGISHIYNYDIPRDASDYVHRIGRTARAGKSGLVINIIAQRDYDNFSKVINSYREFKIEKQERPFIKETPMPNSPSKDRRNSYNKNSRPQRGEDRAPRRTQSNRPNRVNKSAGEGRTSAPRSHRT